LNYADVIAGHVTLADCIEAARMLDWREHCDAKVAQSRPER
jgi:hypothetical protein